MISGTDYREPREATIDPQESAWTIAFPGSSRGPRTVASPLSDHRFLTSLADLREWSGRPVRRGDPQARGIEDYLHRLADQVGSRLTEVLAPDLGKPDPARTRLIVRVLEGGSLAERILALPWELAAGEVVREAVAAGAPELPPPVAALTVAAHIAVPENLSPLNYEEEALRLQTVLAPLGHRAVFSDLGRLEDLQDLVGAAGEAGPHAVHFSGHGRQGLLAFEDELGFADEVAVEEAIRRLRAVLLDPGLPGRFPGLFYLSSRGLASAVPDAAPSDFESAPLTAARLHRGGFAMVAGYFGPIDSELASRAEEAFYRALARGELVLGAISEARATLGQPLGEPGQERWYPLGRTLLQVYLRGPDRPLAEEGAAATDGRLVRRHKVEVSGLPVLEQGFIGRRDLQHEILRRIRAGARLLVLQGLGGLGKSALAGQLVSRLLAPGEPADRLILRCREVVESGDPILDLWAQAEAHGDLHTLPGWRARASYLRTTLLEPAEGLAATLRQIRCDRPNLVIYIDNAETLQVGPDDPTQRLGNWLPGMEEWWAQMERLADEGALILASTRYAWQGLSSQAHLGIAPLGMADTLRLIETFEELGGLAWQVRRDLAARVEGHPRAVEILDRLVGFRRRAMSEAPRDPWAELIEPILPEAGKLLREDLLLEALWHLLSAPAREQARILSVLRQPAPLWVVDRLGVAHDELIRASLLTRYREPVQAGTRIRWTDRWGLHGAVRELAAANLDNAARGGAHHRAGEAWAAWLEQPGWLRTDQQEAVHHLHAAGEANRAWSILYDLFQWLRVQGRYQEARSLLEESIAVGLSGEPRQIARRLVAQLRTVLGESGPEIDLLYPQLLAESTSPALRAETLHDYAVYLDLVGRAGEAEGRVQQAFGLKRNTPGVPPHEIAMTRVLLGRVLESLGRYEEAERELRLAVPILADAPEPIRPQLSVALHSLARVLDKRGLHAEAEARFREAAELDRSLGGEDDPQYGVSLQSLGWILAERGKAVEAEGWLRRALAIQERTFGAEHPETATTKLTLARALSMQQRHHEAEELAREVVAIDNRTLTEDDPNRALTLTALAGFLHAQARYSEAEPPLREALQLQQTTLGPEHPSLVSTLTNLAGVLVEQDRAAEAEPLLERALRIARAAQGPEGPEVAKALPWLAQAQSLLGRLEARGSARRALVLLLKALGPEHPTTRRWVTILQRIADDEAS